MRNTVAALTLMASNLMPLPGVAAAADEPPKLDRAEIEALVHDYIMQNPQVVVEAIQLWQRQQQVAQMLPQIKLYRGFLERDPDQPVLGNPDGDVTIVEFFDYQCGFCKRHYPVMRNLVERDGNIRYVIRHFPIKDKEGEAPVSYLGALAAMAAHKQGKFEPFHSAMMGNKGKLTEDRIYEVATTVGLNVAQLKIDMKDAEIAKSVRNTRSVAADIGFSGTPGYIIGEEVILGAQGIEAMEAAVAQARAQAQTQTEKAAPTTGR